MLGKKCSGLHLCSMLATCVSLFSPSCQSLAVLPSPPYPNTTDDTNEISTTYDATILADSPVALWGMCASNPNEYDLTGNGNTGTYIPSIPRTAALPNGDDAAELDGSSQYLTVPSNEAFSIPTTGYLTWEAWIKPSVADFSIASRGGYVSWLGKCANYSPTCEWEGRMYSASSNRPNRLSAYAFNLTAGRGSGAYWQPNPGVIQVDHWYHVVGQFTTHTTTPANSNTTQTPGEIDIWVNGIKWNQARHGQTGLMSQYNIVPQAADSPLNIGSKAQDNFFKGAIGKVAIYDYLLSDARVKAHYTAMTGKEPTGSCTSTCSLGGVE